MQVQVPTRFSSVRMRAIRSGLIGLLAQACCTPAVASDDWLPVAPAELAIQSEPKALGAPAILLYRQVDRDDTEAREHVYKRIKILTEEGRQLGDVHITYLSDRDSIRAIQARVIHPDGRVVGFDGTVYERSVSEEEGHTVREKTFTLPDVQVGCIVEYQYSRRMDSRYVYNSVWELSDALFTKVEKFTLRPYSNLTLRWSWPHGLPQNVSPPAQAHPYGIISLEAHDLAPFTAEEYAPPDDQLQYRVNFIYSDERRPQLNPTAFWTDYGKSLYRADEKWLKVSKNMSQALGQILSPEDSAETKVRKIYARVQQLQNLTNLPDGADKDDKTRRAADFADAGDVWDAGFGNRNSLALVLVALARAAGLQADIVIGSRRDQEFLNPSMMNTDQIGGVLVMVRVDGKDLFLYPGDRLVGFGTLPWALTAVQALHEGPDGGTWISTPTLQSSQTHIDRNAKLAMQETGELTGTVTVTFTGQEALWRRNHERTEDAAARRKFLEQYLLYDLPPGSRVTLSNQPDWDGAGTPLTAEFSIAAPNWVIPAGRRQLFPSGLLAPHGQKTDFKKAAVRVHPLYFWWPYQYKDTIAIEMPAGWTATKIPPARALDLVGLSFAASAESMGHELRLVREFSLDLLITKPEYFDAVRSFFDGMRASDEEPIVFETNAAPSKP
jgi:hypothetical protein